MKTLKLFLFSIILLSASQACAFGIFNVPYNGSDSTFNKLAMRVYSSGSPFTFSSGAYTYNALPITTTMSGCKIIAVIRRTQGFNNKDIENYKICGGSISETENTNPAGWDNLPSGIKPVINDTIQEARQYGKATANYYGYRVVAKTGVYIGQITVYILNGIKLTAIMNF